MLNIGVEHKNHLKLIKGQPQQVIVNLCKLASQFIQNGLNAKKYTVEAQKLQVSIDVITNCIFALVQLILLSCKNQLNDEDFKNLLINEDFSDVELFVLQQFYQFKKNEIVQLQSLKNSNHIQHYHDLQWRFDIKLATRTMPNIQNSLPSLTIQLKLKSHSNTGDNQMEIDSKILQINVSNLLYLVNELESAVNESKSRNSRKLKQIFEALL